MTFFILIVTGQARALEIEVEVSASKICHSSTPYLLVVSKQIMGELHFVYQTEVPHGGQSYFNLVDGEYVLDLMSDSKCFQSQKVTSLQAGEQKIRMVLEGKW